MNPQIYLEYWDKKKKFRNLCNLLYYMTDNSDIDHINVRLYSSYFTMFYGRRQSHILFSPFLRIRDANSDAEIMNLGNMKNYKELVKSFLGQYKEMRK